MPTVLTPARPAFAADGTPYSSDYGDIYHSADGGAEQAHHVFLRGNGLPERWRNRSHFTILETGFGFGINFLATWQAWRADVARCARLHFVSIEKHPFVAADLAILHARYPEFDVLSAQLRAAWPLLLPGMHRLHLDQGRVTLTLVFGDVLDVLPRLWLGADAFYLDGFAPDKNPTMWAPQAFKACARLARSGATVATYTAAASVRQALAAAGFEVDKREGFGRKRHSLAGRFAPRWKLRAYEPPEALGDSPRQAIVIGAGLAGSAVCERLAGRDWQVTLIDRCAGPAMETSGNPAGLLHPQLARDDSYLARLTRAGFLYALQRLAALGGEEQWWSRCGVLKLAADADEERRMADALGVLGFPHEFVHFADRATASARTGLALPSGGWLFPQAGWVRPPALCARLLDSAGSRLVRRFGSVVARVERAAESWRAVDANGAILADAAVVVLANGADLVRLLPAHHLPLQRVRGQISLLPAKGEVVPRLALGQEGYVLPPIDGQLLVGATYDHDSEPSPRPCDDAANLDLLERMLPALTGRYTPVDASGRVGFRCVTPDRLPLIGPIADETAAHAHATGLGGAHSRDLPRLPGLYCASGYASRGLVWAQLGAELLASQIEGEPPPLERELLEAIDPGRFLLHALRRQRR